MLKAPSPSTRAAGVSPDLLRLSLTYVHYWYGPRGTVKSVTYPPANYRGEGENHIMALVVEVMLEQLKPGVD